MERGEGETEECSVVFAGVHDGLVDPFGEIDFVDYASVERLIPPVGIRNVFTFIEYGLSMDC